MATKNLIELRSEARELGIENYSKYSKEELALIIEQKKAGVTVAQDESVIVSEEEAQELAEKEAKGEVETISAEEVGELTPAGKKKLSPEEKLAARRKAKEEAQAAKEAEKEAKKKAKEDEKARKLAEKAAKKAEKAEKAKKEKSSFPPAAALNLTPKGEKPEFRADTSSRIYDELLKNDGRSYGTIAREIGSHYNMVRRIAETYFVPVDAPTIEAPVENQTEASEVAEEAAE